MPKGVPAVPLLLLCLALGPRGLALAEDSHPGIGIESMYSEAVLAYNRKQGAEALRILDELLKAAPNHVEALELKALTLKTKGDDARSLEVYQRLVSLKAPGERGPYHFEIGVILHRQKKFEVAKPHFRKAIELRFNDVTSHLFLGLMAFSAGELSAAQESFAVVKSSAADELRVVARYYLGLIHFKNGYGPGGTSELTAARELASELPESKMARDIHAAAEKILAPFNREQNFAHASLMGQYDSNISLLPATGASGKATPKLNLAGGFGRMGSPMATIQWVVAYRLLFNRNLSDEARDYEFFTNIPSFYLNYKPLGTTTAGLKAEGSFAFQNQAESPGSASRIFRKYNLGADLGLYVKHQLDRHAQLQLDAGIRPQRYFSESGLNGNTFLGRLGFRREFSRALNPSFSASLERNGAAAADSRYLAVGGGIANVLRLDGDLVVNLSLDYLSTAYRESSAGRADRSLSARASFSRPLGARFSLVGEGSFTHNVSSVAETYSYQRALFGLGVSWVL